MENDNEQLSSAENEEGLSEVEEKLVPQDGESDAPQEQEETDEQKNARALEEDAERKRVKEEKRQASVQRRFDELTRQRYEEKARADALELIVKQYGQPQQQQAKQSDEPQRDQFDSYEDYLRASAVYEARQLVKQEIEQMQAKQKEISTISQVEKSRQDAEKQFLERRVATEKTIPDYREVVEDWEPNLPSSVVDTIIRLPEGPLLTYHLAKNPELEEQFRTAPEYMHGVLIGQLLSTLKSTPKTTSAPPPGKPVSAAKAASSDGPPADPEQYYAWAQRQQKAGKLR